ncbi:MAG: hypothetical protein Q4G02_00565 [bacterium]|nr:hypothetical protein [bacterium]
MQTKIESLTEPEQEKAAFDRGLALSELSGLFVYFLQNTPEGKQVKKDLENSWQETFLYLKSNKSLRGNDFSCSRFFRQIGKELLSTHAPAPVKKNQSSPVVNKIANNKVKTKTYQKKTLRFKNV